MKKIGYSVVLVVLIIDFAVLLGFKPAVKVSEKVETPSHSKSIAKQIAELMTDEELVGQIIMISLPGKKFNRDMKNLIEKVKPAGIIIVKENVSKDKAKFIELINSIKSSYNDIPMFIGVDQEGGEVERLKNLVDKLPPASKLARKGSDYIYTSYRKIGSQLRSLGINMNFAPVVDVLTKEDGFIDDRSFGSSPDKVTECVISAIKGLMDSGIIPVAKHFPGYGGSPVDPHEDVPVDSTLSLDEYIKPFKRIASITPAIMTSHTVFKRFSGKPASLSRKILSILRREIGFKGMIVSDDIRMKAVTKNTPFTKAAVESVKAGTDLIISVSRKDNWVKNAINLKKSLLKALKNGEIKRDRLIEAVARIIELKLHYFPFKNWNILNRYTENLPFNRS